MRTVRQGELYFADLNPVKGHEQAGYRPVLVIQNDILNSNLTTVIIVPLASNLAAKGYLTTCFLSKKQSKLKNDSVALIFQLRTIDKRRLKKRVSKLPDNVFKELKKQLALVF